MVPDKEQDYWNRHFEFRNFKYGFVIYDPETSRVPSLIEIK